MYTIYNTGGRMNFFCIELHETHRRLKQPIYVHNQAFRYLARWTEKMTRLGDTMIWEWLRSRCFATSTMRARKLQDLHCENLEAGINALSGDVKVILDEGKPGGPATKYRYQGKILWA
jgi:hypothetical protein